jgi:hypothetical protein
LLFLISKPGMRGSVSAAFKMHAVSLGVAAEAVKGSRRRSKGSTARMLFPSVRRGVVADADEFC